MSAPPLDLGLASPAGIVATAVERLAASHSNVVTVPVTGDLLDRLTVGGKERLRRVSLATWEHASEDVAWFGLGVAARAAGRRGESREPAARFLEWLRAGASDGTGLSRPRVAFGAEFDSRAGRRDPRWAGMGGWQALLPRIVVAQEGGRWEASFVVARSERIDSRALTDWLESALARTRERPIGGRAAGSEALPGPEAWQQAVSAAVQEIRDGSYEKVVLARARRAPANVPAADVLDRLAERYPQCFVFRFDGGDSVFVGASPERLVALSGGVVRADSLAGSRQRGASPELDAELAAELLHDHKEREEHAFVVEAIRAALQPVCAELSAPAEPTLMRLRNIQHLHTPIEGRAREGVTILDLADRMHPTPAIGGWPVEPAMDAIRRLEGLDRGWYGGPIGWIDLNGDGELAVALRSALIGPGGATLYAGCGIVVESDPVRELAETELKFRPLLEALS